MREAIGSSWILYIAVIFIIIYIFFIGFVMNYASAYRAANYVISQIENCQGEDNCNGVTMESITNTVKTKYGYLTPKRNPNPDGVITKRCKTNCVGTNCKGVIYQIDLPVEFDLPLLGGIRWMTVRAETKTIPNKTC